MIQYVCSTCGTALESDDHMAGQQERCPCGAVNVVPIAAAMPPMIGQYASAPVASGKDTAPFVLGIISCVAWLCPLIGLATSIVGLVLGLKVQKAAPTGKAKAGVIMCIIGLVLTVVNMIIGVIIAVADL